MWKKICWKKVVLATVIINIFLIIIFSASDILLTGYTDYRDKLGSGSLPIILLPLLISLFPLINTSLSFEYEIQKIIKDSNNNEVDNNKVKFRKKIYICPLSI